MKEEPVLTGFNTKWANSLPDLTPLQCQDFILQLSAMPLKQCDAKRNCDNPVEWWVWFHGCDSESVCDACRQMWVFEINRALGEQGAVPCTDCGETFTTLKGIMKWRAI